MLDNFTFEHAGILVVISLLIEMLRHTLYYYNVLFFDTKDGRLPVLTQKDLQSLLKAANTVVSDDDLVNTTAPLMIAALTTILWFRLYNMLFYFIVISSICMFFPYMQKCSQYYPYCSGGVFYRSWHHHFMTSSLIYIGGGVAAIIGKFQYITFLCFMTVIGSLLYHRHREGQFFNVDNIFATSKLVLCLYAMTHSIDNWPEYAILGVVSCPLVAFLFVICGDPSELVSIPSSDDPNVMCCVRNERTAYQTYHSIWHVFSGMGPILAVIYFHFYPFEQGKHSYLEHMKPYISEEECLLIWCLGIATAGNIALNWVSIAPLI